MWQLFKIFMSLSVASTLIVIVGILCGIESLDSFGRRQEWWGVPNRFVEIRNFRFTDTDSALPLITGTLINNYDKPLSTFHIDVDFFRCPKSKPDRDNHDGCNQIWPEGSQVHDSYEVHLGIPPHTTADFSEMHSSHDYWQVVSENRKHPGYYITYVPYITYIW
jgi:hypothetical protein